MKSEASDHLNDAELIEKIKSGESSRYFQTLYTRYHSRVLDKCFSFVKNRELAEELTEDIFSKVFEKLASFQQKSTFSSWLYSVTYNHCIDYLREKKRLHYPSWNEKNEIPEIMDESDEPLADINYDNLMIVMEQIHPEEKALLMMKYHDDLSIKEISKSLRISENAAKMRLKRARTRVVYLYTQKYLKD